MRPLACFGALRWRDIFRCTMWREIEILNLAVLPQERRRGHGRRLTRVVLRLARKLGMEKAFLEVRSDNVPAVSLYLACGFRYEGIRRKYYADGTDAHIYVCSLR